MAYTLTEKDILGANAYVPIMEKMELIKEISARCISRVQVTLDAEEDGGYKTPMPDTYMENILLKALYLRGVLVGKYFGKEVNGKMPETVTDFQIPANEYDMWGNIISQIERFKGRQYPAEVRDKAYDILSDYRDFEKRLNTVTYQLLSLKTDFCTRYMEMIMLQTTPQAMEDAKKELESLKAELEKAGGKRAKG